MATDSMTVKINPNDKGSPVERLADAELHFTDGPLEGLKLIGFGIWERRGGSGRNVTFPARQYSVNGEKRSFTLLRPIADTAAHERIRDLVLDAYAEYEKRGNRVDRQPERPSRALRSFIDVIGRLRHGFVRLHAADRSSCRVAPVIAKSRGRIGRVKTAKRRSAAEGSLEAPKRPLTIGFRSDASSTIQPRAVVSLSFWKGATRNSVRTIDTVSR